MQLIPVEAATTPSSPLPIRIPFSVYGRVLIVLLNSKAGDGPFDTGDAMDLVHHQPTDVARVRGFDHHDDIIRAGDRVGRAHAGHTAERPDDRPDLTRLRLDQDIGSGVHNSTSPSQALGDTPRAAPMRLSCRN